ncbi:unnamed protein product [Gadus morhua 'NCC']
MNWKDATENEIARDSLTRCFVTREGTAPPGPRAEDLLNRHQPSLGPLADPISHQQPSTLSHIIEVYEHNDMT